MLSLLIGIPIGIFCSLAAWWVLFHIAVPKVEFAAQIRRIVDPANTGKCSLRMTNIGRRPIVECTVYAELRLPGLDPANPARIWLIRLPLRHDVFAYWPPKNFRYCTFMPYAPDARVAPFLTPGTEYSVDQLLQLRSGASVRIVLIGNDGFSGSRRAVRSKEYFVSDVAPLARAREPGTLPDDEIGVGA